MSVCGRLDHVDGSDNPLLHQFTRFPGDDGTDPLATYLQWLTAFLLGSNDGMAFFQVMHHWFLTVDSLTRLEGSDGNVIVPVIWRSNTNGVDVVSFEDLAVVTCGKQVIAITLLTGRKMAIIKVAHRH